MLFVICLLKWNDTIIKFESLWLLAIKNTWQFVLKFFSLNMCFIQLQFLCMPSCHVFIFILVVVIEKYTFFNRASPCWYFFFPPMCKWLFLSKIKLRYLMKINKAGYASGSIYFCSFNDTKDTRLPWSCISLSNLLAGERFQRLHRFVSQRQDRWDRSPNQNGPWGCEW